MSCILNLGCRVEWMAYFITDPHFPHTPIYIFVFIGKALHLYQFTYWWNTHWPVGYMGVFKNIICKIVLVTSGMISLHWFRQWLCVVRQQTWANIDWYPCHHMASLGLNELNHTYLEQDDSFKMKSFLNFDLVWLSILMADGLVQERVKDVTPMC